MRRLTVIILLSLFMASVSVCGVGCNNASGSQPLESEFEIEVKEENEAVFESETTVAGSGETVVEEIITELGPTIIKAEDEEVPVKEEELQETPNPEPAEKAKETEQPVETSRPDESVKPTKTPQGTPAASPKVTPTPKPTTVPAATQTPTPVVTATPVPTITPEATSLGCKHDYHNMAIQEATCAQNRVLADVCSLCGDIQNRVIDSTVTRPAHVRSASSATGTYEPATCYNNGQDYFICDNCGCQILYGTPALGHDLDVKVIEGNCCQERWTKYTCKREGCNYQDKELDYEIDKDKHDWVTKTGQEYNEEKHCLVSFDIVVCSRCNQPKDGTKVYKENE